MAQSTPLSTGPAPPALARSARSCASEAASVSSSGVKLNAAVRSSAVETRPPAPLTKRRRSATLIGADERAGGGDVAKAGGVGVGHVGRIDGGGEAGGGIVRAEIVARQLRVGVPRCPRR
jgi:hypothetical protein